MRLFAFLLIACLLPAQDATNQPGTNPDVGASSNIEKLMNAANAKYVHRDYAASLDLYRQAQAAIEQTPPENPQRYAILKRLAAISGARGEYKAAIDYLQGAIEWRWEKISRDDATALLDQVQQVNLYRAMENNGQARTVLMAVMSKHQALSGFRTLVMADDFSLLGQIYINEKNFQNAVEQLETALAIRGAISGPLDVSLVPDLDRLGAVYLARHGYDEAEPVFRKALIIRESVLGTENADLLATVDGLAYSCFGQEKFDEAELLYQRLIHLWTKSVGETHPMLASALDKVGIFYAEQKKYEQAKAAFERANAIRTHSLAEGLFREASHERIAGNLSTAAELYARELRVLDPPDDVYSGLREQAATNLRAVEEAAPKSGAKKSSTKK